MAERVIHLIEFKNVSKTYPNGVKGLKNVNLTIDQGEFVAIIGLSGAGKSTLIRTINRMIDTGIGVAVALLINWLLSKERVTGWINKILKRETKEEVKKEQ